MIIIDILAILFVSFAICFIAGALLVATVIGVVELAMLAISAILTLGDDEDQTHRKNREHKRNA